MVCAVKSGRSEGATELRDPGPGRAWAELQLSLTLVSSPETQDSWGSSRALICFNIL